MKDAEYYALLGTIFIAPTMPKGLNAVLCIVFLGLSIFSMANT